ncbi:hypothetical protein NL532_23995 [Mesorhizobium sp. C120A]|uniref:hypothetical protein n=1 Tax=unclassified Mesorhizobium TaxID=325217 RepID=UPI00041A5FB5|nr:MULTISPECIES: hypothetical protein [unclassified Mesorhizobium]WJI43671.1 hypothetical protein NL532_23995 [Mesorhizobium sp. C120A]
MTRIGVALLALMWMLATVYAGEVAGKFDGKEVATEWYQAHLDCRLPVDGQTNQQADEECARRDELTQSLRTHDFCFDANEQEWAKCTADQE